MTMIREIDKFIRDEIYKKCDGKPKYWLNRFYGGVVECPDCGHWNATTWKMSFDDHINDYKLLCHCCGCVEELEDE